GAAPPGAQDNQDPRALPQRRRRPQAHLPVDHQRPEDLEKGLQLEHGARRLQDPLRRPTALTNGPGLTHRKSDTLPGSVVELSGPPSVLAEASGRTCSRTRPLPRPRTSTTTPHSAFLPRARPPLRPSSRPPRKNSSTSTSRMSGSRCGATIAALSLCSIIHAVS